MTKNLVLTGLMGAGKSSVGKILASNLNYKFIDTDKLIEEQENCTITEIFRTKGEKHFRQVETDVIKQVAPKQNVVISLGGGSLENEQNLINLKENSVLFYLKATPETLYSRIKNEKGRPLLANENPLDVLKNLLQKRENNYSKSDYIIFTDDKTVEQITEEIMRLYDANR